MKKVTSDIIFSLVYRAFASSWDNKANIDNNAQRSSYFVSKLSEQFSSFSKSEALVQKTDIYGNKISGEWLLDIAIINR